MSNGADYIVYRNRFNEVKCYAGKILESDGNYARVKDTDAGYVKTFKCEKIISIESDFSKATELAKEIQLQYKPIPRPETHNFDTNYSCLLYTSPSPRDS